MAKARLKYVELKGDNEKIVIIKGRRACVYNRFDDDGDYSDIGDCDKNELIAAFTLTHVRAALKVAKGDQDAIDEAEAEVIRLQDLLGAAQENLDDLKDNEDPVLLEASEGGQFEATHYDDGVVKIGCSEATTAELEEIQDLLLG